MKKILKTILIISVSISIISYGIYYLFVPEFKRNLIGNGMYIYVEKNFVKHCRVPIYDWNKDGNNYNMNVLKIRTEKGAKGKVVFKEKRYEENEMKNINKEIIVNLN